MRGGGALNLQSARSLQHRIAKQMTELVDTAKQTKVLLPKKEE